MAESIQIVESNNHEENGRWGELIELAEIRFELEPAADGYRDYLLSLLRFKDLERLRSVVENNVNFCRNRSVEKRNELGWIAGLSDDELLPWKDIDELVFEAIADRTQGGEICVLRKSWCREVSSRRIRGCQILFTGVA